MQGRFTWWREREVREARVERRSRVGLGMNPEVWRERHLSDGSLEIEEMSGATLSLGTCTASLKGSRGQEGKDRANKRTASVAAAAAAITTSDLLEISPCADESCLLSWQPMRSYLYWQCQSSMYHQDQESHAHRVRPVKGLSPSTLSFTHPLPLPFPTGHGISSNSRRQQRRHMNDTSIPENPILGVMPPCANTH